MTDRTDLPSQTFAVARDVHSRRFHDELVVLDLVGGEYFALDEVAARIWEGLASGRPLGDVVRALTDFYDSDAARIGEDARELAAELVRRRLLVRCHGP